MGNLENEWFECDVFQRKTTINHCKRCCYKIDAEQCAKEKLKKDMKIEKEIQETKELEKQKCPRCGDLLVGHLSFAFCPTCGFPDDDDEYEEEVEEW